MVQCSRQKQISLKIIPIINVWIDYLKSEPASICSESNALEFTLFSPESTMESFLFFILKNFSAGLRHPIAWT